MGLPLSPFGDEDSMSWATHQGTFTLTRPLPFYHPCAKEDAPPRVCCCAPSGAKTCQSAAGKGTYTFTRPLPSPPSCAKEDGPVWPCGTVPLGMKNTRKMARTTNKGTSPIATRERRPSPLHALSCTEEESPGSLCLRLSLPGRRRLPQRTNKW